MKNSNLKMTLLLLAVVALAVVSMGATSDHLSSLFMSVVPGVDNLYDLGSSSKYWRNIYVNNITSTSNITFTGNITLERPYWDDLRTPVNAIKLSNTKPPTWTAYKGSEVLAFSDQATAGNEEFIFFSVQMPHNYKEGTAIYPHVHFVPEDNTGGNVRWQFTYSWASYGQAFPTEQAVYVNAACGNVTDVHRMGDFGAIVGTNQTISSMLLCQIKRNSSNAGDTYNGKSAYLLEFDIHYEIDGFGSKEIATK